MEMSVVHGPYSVGKTYIARSYRLSIRLRVIPYICLDAWRMGPFIFDQLRELKVPSGSFKTLEDALRGVFQASLDKADHAHHR